MADEWGVMKRSGWTTHGGPDMAYCLIIGPLPFDSSIEPASYGLRVGGPGVDYFSLSGPLATVRVHGLGFLFMNLPCMFTILLILFTIGA